MTPQYRESSFVRPNYEYNKLNPVKQGCPGQCTCNFGTRTSYDELQRSWVSKGQKDIKFPTVKVIPVWK